MNPNKLNLDPDPESCPNLDPDQSLLKGKNQNKQLSLILEGDKLMQKTKKKEEEMKEELIIISNQQEPLTARQINDNINSYNII